MSAASPPARLCGRYELLEQVGEGGMATVWKAVSHGAEGFKRAVAIKRVRDEHRANPHFRDLFVEEARVDAALRHPNIVQVYDFDVDEQGAHFLVTEWIDGPGLDRYLEHFRSRGEPTPFELVALITRDVLHALDATHGYRSPEGALSPIYHRDITPHNILLDVTGAVKLADFGVARAMDRGRMTHPDIVKGKLSYMAPEMTRGLGPNVRTDLYAVGIVCWEALTGKRLFQADTDAEVFRMLMAPSVPPVASQRADLPAELAAAVDRALATDPQARFSSAFEMLYAVDRVLRGLPEPVYMQNLARSVRATRDAVSPPIELLEASLVVEESSSPRFEPLASPQGAQSRKPSLPKAPPRAPSLRPASGQSRPPPPRPGPSTPPPMRATTEPSITSAPRPSRPPSLPELPLSPVAPRATPRVGSHPPRLPKLPTATPSSSPAAASAAPDSTRSKPPLPRMSK